MRKTSFNNNKLIRSLMPKPDQEDIQNVSDLVWRGLSKERISMMQEVSTNSVITRRAYIFNAITAITIVALIASTSYLAVEQSKLKKQLAQKQETGQSNSVVVLSGTADQYFIPDKTIAQATATPDAASSTTTTNNQKLAKLNLDSNLYNYLGSETANVTSGVRRPEIVSQKNSLIQKAYAAQDPYPAVYYLDYGSASKTIKEVNMYTGETREIITEKGDGAAINSLSFNERNQQLVYCLKSNSNDFTSNDIVVLSVNTGKRTVIAENVPYGLAKWSPDMNSLAVSYSEYEGIVNNTSKYKTVLKVYSARNYGFTSFDLPGDLLSYGYNWTSDSRSIGFISLSAGRQFILVDAITGGQTVSVEYPDTVEINSATRSIDGSTYGFVALNSGENQGVSVFAKYNNATKKFEEYSNIVIAKNLSGNMNWLGTKDMSKVIYSTFAKGVVHKLYVSDLANNNQKELDISKMATGQVRIVGWTGNEQNVVLWDMNNVFWNMNIESNTLTQITQ